MSSARQNPRPYKRWIFSICHSIGCWQVYFFRYYVGRSNSGNVNCPGKMTANSGGYGTPLLLHSYLKRHENAGVRSVLYSTDKVIACRVALTLHDLPENVHRPINWSWTAALGCPKTAGAPRNKQAHSVLGDRAEHRSS